MFASGAEEDGGDDPGPALHPVPGRDRGEQGRGDVEVPSEFDAL